MNDLETTWALLARNDSLRYFAKRGNLTLIGVVRTVSKLHSLIDLNPSWDWYILLNRARARASLKARSRDIVEWSFVLLDIDPLCQGADPFGALNFLLDKHQLHPYCAILDSGRGFQAWLSLRPLPVTNPTLIERATKAWLAALGPCGHGCRVDTSCSDLARVARLPGTINHKTGRPARMLSLPHDQLDPHLILDSYHPPPEPERISRPPTDASLSTILPHLTETACNFLTQGVSQPGRHSACYATARSLHEARVPMEKALLWVLTGAGLCTPILSIREAARCVRNAYEKEPSHGPN